MPKIEFIWSWIYQLEIHSHQVKKERYDFEEYEEYVKKHIDSVRSIWAKVENETFNLMEVISGLKWKKEIIECYVIKMSSHLPISQPLTIPIQFESNEEIYTLSPERYLDMMVHEIIHNLFIQNESLLDEYFEYLIGKKYKGEEFNTAIHVPLHALHKKIFLKIFDESRLKDEIEHCNYYPDYKRSWEIVNKEGEDRIIEEMKSFIMSSS